MDHQTSHTIITTCAQETRELGRLIGRQLTFSTVIWLSGDLGSGKTCFVQGLAKGLEVPDGFDITSPTYTLIHDYPGRLPLVHVDLYRIHDEMDAEAIGLWDIMSQESVVAVEWADRLKDAFWPETRTLRISFGESLKERRHIRLFGYGLQISNLIKEIGVLWNSLDAVPTEKRPKTQ